ncbi:ribonucleases P/MRP protein subunit POP1-domain-containing protein [Fusarium tricinctum]|uniref:Ribonucleases P/MRP protein subunit POP1-domain-containing protein n=1 Tax=Fusarium tricinctum TaxID=61284 RepID=A0A8K0W744_9HYPO|nr:ribonucleases P/MRP protein subunit POP1-domain-containing protein [Fusarium tricinctum]
MAPGPSAGAQSGSDNRKRKADTPASNGRGDNFAQKRSVVFTARSIPAQPAEAALKDGELDLQAFVAAHEFEIRALEQSMATSKVVGSSRAFQKVPRGLRRRTASHNPKRVPRRLRKRAHKEMAEDNTPVVEARRRKPRTTRARIRAETARKLGILAARKRRASLKKTNKDGDVNMEGGLAVVGRAPRPKIRRNVLNEPPKPKAKFRKRQLNKTWLPTHSWHAKRARMTDPLDPLWRFAIPLTPNEKIYRPTHRAQGDRGAVVWEMSYMSTIGLYGNRAGLERVLKRIGVVQESCWNDKGRKWRLGSRSWTGILTRKAHGGQPNHDNQQIIGPCTILWNPEQSTEEANQNPKKEQRQVFLRIHPSAFLELFNELLSLTKQETPRLYIEDLRFEIGSIDLTGPGSTEALLSVLHTYPTQDKTKEKHAELFEGLAGLTNAAALPAGALLSFSAQDPRLHYPPKRLVVSEDADSQLQLLERIAAWPADEGLKPYPIFDREARHQASLLPSQKQIDRRKTKKAPGSSLKPTATDPPIPITLLISRTGTGTQTQGTWTLLTPWKCIQHIWYCLVHYPLSSGGNPRFAGLNEIRQVAFERGQLWFPGDYPGTRAGAEWELEERRKRKATWEKRPKSKRTAWESLDLGGGRKGEVGDGFASDFELLFASTSTQENKEPQADAMDVDVGNDETTESAQTSKQRKEPPLYQLRQVTRDFFNRSITSSSTPPTIPANAVLGVRISLISRGIVTSCARIYRLPSRPTTAPQSSETEVPATLPPASSSLSSSLPHDLRSQWLAQAPSSITTKTKSSNASRPRDLDLLKRQLAAELIAKPVPYPPAPANKSDMNGHPLVPNAEDLIGFVTTGSFSLSEGHGMAIGSIAVEKVLDDVKKYSKEGRYCIVRNAGESVGWLAKWEAA